MCFRVECTNVSSTVSIGQHYVRSGAAPTQVSFQYVKTAYDAKSKLNGKAVSGSTLVVQFGPKVAGHDERHLVSEKTACRLRFPYFWVFCCI